MLIVFSYLPLKAQQENQLNNIIISSLKSYISWNNSLRDRLNLSSLNCYYLCKDGIPLSFPYDSLENIVYGSLENIEGLTSMYKRKLNEGIGFLFVNINLTGANLTITVSGKDVKRIKKRQLHIAIVDWGQYTYEYSCETREWELKQVKYGEL